MIKKLLYIVFGFSFLLGSLLWGKSFFMNNSPKPTEKIIKTVSENSQIAVLAGGCFWCVEADLEKLEGVSSVVSGYAGGLKDDAKYEVVASGQTDHREVVKVVFDPSLITFETILESFLKKIDPTDAQGQFADRGYQYSPAIYYFNPLQEEIAQKVLKDYQSHFEKKISVEVVPFSGFFPAEEYHQDYYKKNSLRYKFYRTGSGRDAFLKRQWKK